jgi:hypothetical protein
MALNLYRRHRRDCKAGHPEDHLSSEFDERKKAWKRCECPIVASGTLNRKFRRQSTGQWEWANARAIAGQWEAVGWEAENSQFSLDPPVIASCRSPKADRIVYLAELRTRSCQSGSSISSSPDRSTSIEWCWKSNQRQNISKLRSCGQVSSSRNQPPNCSTKISSHSSRKTS